MAEAKSYKIWYWIFLITGISGIIEIASQSVRSARGLERLGYLSIGALNLFGPIFGSDIAVSAAVFLDFISGLGILWLVLAWLCYRKIKAVDHATTDVPGMRT